MSGKIRDASLDETKGLAEIIVILTHIVFLGGIRLLGDSLELVFSTLHNPAFFFIAGLLFKKSCEKYSLRELISLKINSVLRLFVIWGFILGTLHFFIFGNIGPIYLHYVESFNCVWFLGELFVAYIFVIVAYKLPVSSIVVSFLWIITMVVSFFCYTFLGKLFSFSFIMWLGFCDSNKGRKASKMQSVIYIFLWSICIVFMLLSGKFVFYEINNKPGIYFFENRKVWH